MHTFLRLAIAKIRAGAPLPFDWACHLSDLGYNVEALVRRYAP